jgi:hypothetical protein
VKITESEKNWKRKEQEVKRTGSEKEQEVQRTENGECRRSTQERTEKRIGNR